MSGDGKTYEMMWDCGACGTPKLLAKSHKHCPTCGSPQDPTWRYFPPEDEKVAVEDHVFMGKDKVCGACGTPCAAQATFCPGCGSDLDGSKEAATRQDQVVAEGVGFSEDDADAANAEHKARRKAEQAAKMADQMPPPPPPKKSMLLPAIAVLAGIAFIACLGVFFLWKKDVSIVNTGHAWERTIQIEEMKNVTKSAWDDEVPRGAELVECKQEKRSTKQVADGEECSTRRKDNGDGTYSEKQECKTKYKSEPVYGSKCKYRIDEWTSTRKAKASGNGLTPEPSWPDSGISRKGNCLGCEREGAKSESYTLKFKDSGSGKALSCTVPQKTWAKVKPKSKWEAQVGVVSGALDCDNLKPLK